MADFVASVHRHELYRLHVATGITGIETWIPSFIYPTVLAYDYVTTYKGRNTGMPIQHQGTYGVMLVSIFNRPWFKKSIRSHGLLEAVSKQLFQHQIST